MSVNNHVSSFAHCTDYPLFGLRNVLLDKSGHLKVTDFGLSKIAQEKDAKGYLMTGGTGSCKPPIHT